MQVKDLVYNYDVDNLTVIKDQCNQFLYESDGLPLVRNLPQTYQDFQKVKVRKRKASNDFSDTFNNAFKDEINSLRERAIFTNSVETIDRNSADFADVFYVFPINGYQFLYSKEVENSTNSYKKVFESIFNQMNEESAAEVFTDLLKFNYITEDLAAGIESGAEIIIYGISHYYVIRESSIDNYNNLLTRLI